MYRYSTHRFATLLSAALFVALSWQVAPANAANAGNQDFKVTYESYPWSITSHFNIERSDGSQWRASRNNLASMVGFKYYMYDAEGQSLGTLTSRWKDPIAVRHSTANLEFRDAVGDRGGRLRGKFWTTQLLQLNIYDKRDFQVGVVRCSLFDWVTCDVKTDSQATHKIATMEHASWNVWNVTVHRDGLIDQQLLELVPLYLHDYLRAYLYYDAAYYFLAPRLR